MHKREKGRWYTERGYRTYQIYVGRHLGMLLVYRATETQQMHCVVLLVYPATTETQQMYWS
jgi:hypothetical protein